MEEKTKIKRAVIIRILLCMLLFTGMGTIANAQVTITGTVTDELNDPVIGANASIPGTTVGAITDMYGSFKLNVPQNAKVSVSYIGFLTQTFQVGNDRSDNITLIEYVF